jgi:ribosome-binding factor A
MTQRTIRLNQLLLQEFSEELHTRWRTEAVRITFTGFDISPDLRAAILFYSVLGDINHRREATKLLKRILNPLKAEVFKRVPIKYTPEVRYVYDDSTERGVQLVNILDEVAHQDEERDRRRAEANAAAAAKPAPESAQ